MEILFAFWNSMTPLGRIEFIIFVGAMFFYILHMIIHPDFTPHPLAFGIWLVSDTTNYITYTSFSPFWVGAITMVICACIVVIWGIVKIIASKERRQKIQLEWQDITAIIISIISLGVFFFTGNGVIANLMIQVIMIMGFVPLIKDLIESKRVNEPWLSWFLFVVGWAISCYETFYGYTRKIELLYPIVSICGCSFVLFIIFYNQFLTKR